MHKNEKAQHYSTNNNIKKNSFNNLTIYNHNPVELRRKLINNITKNGNKHMSEKALNKSLKATQKSEKKNHSKITKLSIVKTVPTFRIIKLTDKKRRKKSIREIPSLVSSYKSRISLGLKYLIATATTGVHTKQSAFFHKFNNELLSGAYSENSAIATKNNSQIKALNEKKYFRFYRW